MVTPKRKRQAGNSSDEESMYKDRVKGSRAKNRMNKERKNDMIIKLEYDDKVDESIQEQQTGSTSNWADDDRCKSVEDDKRTGQGGEAVP